MTDFSALYRKYAPVVFRFALYLSGDRGEAEDITSETFARAWASPAPVRTETVKAYLYAIARNLFLLSLRERARRGELAGEPADPQPDPHEQSEGRDELRVVLARLQLLPEIDRAALLMRALDATPYEEIARALGVSVSSAKVKVHRARLALAEARRGPFERPRGPV
jgi:RNA polymerase sigma-70 factor (ECF subfamily)